MSGLPDLRFLLSINNENAWSDLLATLMNADHDTTRSALGIDAPGALVVRREVSKSRGKKSSDRPDLVVESHGRIVAVVEVKLLAGLGNEQLERYYQYVPEADRDNCRFLAVSLQRVRLDTAHAMEWRNLTWEELIGPFASSTMGWVAATAKAWTVHIESQVPAVDGDTVWNDIEGIDLYLALRLRTAYLYDNVVVPRGSSKSIQERIWRVVRSNRRRPDTGQRLHHPLGSHRKSPDPGCWQVGGRWRAPWCRLPLLPSAAAGHLV